MTQVGGRGQGRDEVRGLLASSRLDLVAWLANGRRARGMSLADVAARTKIQVRTLELIEAAQFDSLPADVFLRGFIKGYARAVGLSEDEALDRYAACGKEPGPVAAQRRAESAARGAQYASVSPSVSPTAGAFEPHAIAGSDAASDAAPFGGVAAGSLTAIPTSSPASGRVVAEAFVAVVAPVATSHAGHAGTTAGPTSGAVAQPSADAQPAAKSERRGRTTRSAVAAPIEVVQAAAEASGQVPQALGDRPVSAGEVAAAAWASAWSSPAIAVTPAPDVVSEAPASRRRRKNTTSTTLGDKPSVQVDAVDAPAPRRRRTKTTTAGVEPGIAPKATGTPSARKRKTAVRTADVSTPDAAPAAGASSASQLALPSVATQILAEASAPAPRRGLASISEAIASDELVAAGPEALAPLVVPAARLAETVSVESSSVGGLWDPPPAPRYRSDSRGLLGASISAPAGIASAAPLAVVSERVSRVDVTSASLDDAEPTSDVDVDVDFGAGRGADLGADRPATADAAVGADLPTWFAATSAGDADVVDPSPGSTLAAVDAAEAPELAEPLVYGPPVRVSAIAVTERAPEADLGAGRSAEWTVTTPGATTTGHVAGTHVTTTGTSAGWSLSSVSSALAARRARARAPVALVIDDDNPERAERDQLSRERERADRGRTNFLPPILRDQERQARQGGLTLAVIILLIAATLTLSYLMRRPGSGGDGITSIPGATDTHLIG